MEKVNKKIYLSSPHLCGLEEEFVKEAFKSNYIAPLGPHVDGFEKEVTELVGVNAAVALSSGTAAMHMALKALGVENGDIVFCSSLTFSASCNPIIYQNAIPVFIDSEPKSWNMSPKALEKAFIDCKTNNQMPKAVIVVDLYGQSADLDAIKKICNVYQVPIVEDAAEALGSTYKDKYCGAIGDYGVYSFNGNKIITTSSGGMLISNNEEAIKKVRFWATQAKDEARHYQHSELGFNYRMSNILAGIGRGQIKVLSERISRKKEIYYSFKKAFEDITDIEMMPICTYGEPNYWLSVMTIKECSKVKPIDVILALEKENIESRPVWKPMNLQPFYKKYKFFSHNETEISVAEDIFNRGVCLPSDTKMTQEDLNRVVKIIKELF